jgi:peptidoglycan/LPS O-acetylase OafA/YrhL
MGSSEEITLNTEKTYFERRYDIDWLRIIAVLLVFIYHCSRFFDDMEWHVKNSEFDLGMTIFFTFLGGIGMPLFFIISGMATFYFLGIADAKLYAKARFVRLMIPFLFAIFTQIPFQVYLDRVNHSEFTGSFFEFYPQYFNGLYGYGGNFPWTGFHLWFIIILFIFSMITVNLFVYLRKEKNLQKISNFASFFKKSGSLYFFIIPVVLFQLFNPLSILGDFGGYNLFSLLVFYVIGFLIASDRQFKDSIESHRIIALITAIISTLLLGVVAIAFYNYLLFWVLGITYMWSWIIVILGLASKHLNFNHKSRKFLNENVMPFYILHQTIIVIIGFLIVQTGLIIILKYLIICIISFAIIIALVMVIRQFNILRVLFGMSLKKKKIQNDN